MITMTRTSRDFRRHTLAAAVVLALAGAAQAQLSTATIKGQVAGATASTTITAVNKATGATYRGSVRADGSYVIPGLAPGDYDVRVAGQTQAVTLSVGETATLDLNVGAGAQQIVITGTALRQDARNAQLGTVVSRRLIDALPQNTRNFLSSADLAPGVRFQTDASGYSKLSSGAQTADNMNIFIDGVGQKNNILRGAMAGQDVSRGNPFPQSAIGEYRVITQNYKAEYDQVSSAAITAITRSGSNTFSGDAYVDRTGTNWRAKSEFEKEREAQGIPRPAGEKLEYGFGLGGPIVQDRAHFFIAYDGKSIDDTRQIQFRNLNLLPNGGLGPQLRAFGASQVDNFKQDLLFGKLDFQLGADHRLSLSARVRREDDRVAEDRNISAPGNDKNRVNEEDRIDAKWEWTLGDFISEARVGYEGYLYNPRSASSDPFFKYKISTATPQQLNGSQDVAFVGGSPDAQRREQKGVFISEDLTYTGLRGHVMKGGIKLKALEYDLSGTAFGVDTVEVVIDNVTGLPYYANGSCTGTNITNNGANSDQCNIRRAIPAAGAKFDNSQFGIYFQDDWAITRQLEVSLGVRWDYESNMLNNDYVTPADRVAALRGLDGPRYGITPPAGQTYAQSLARGGVNIEEFISNGSSRKAYKGAFAPRFGFSYDITGQRESVLFGGFGRSYARTMANHALDELQKNQQAGGEIWLIKNDYKMPYADQASIGFRQALGNWNAEVALSHVIGKNQFQWFGGNRDASGGYATQSPIDPLWGGPNGFGTLVLGDTVGESKTNSLFLKLDKPYTRASGWQVGAAYTYSDAKTTHKEWNEDLFDWTYGRPGVRGFNTSILTPKHRVVVGAMADTLLPWGLTVGGKLSWDSGVPRRVTNCGAGWDRCVYALADAPDFKQFDVSVSKGFTFGAHTLSLRLDVLNVFDSTNYGGFDDWGGGPGNPQNVYGGDNPNVGKPNSIRGDTRTYRLALGYKF
jgi:outer membrane receptor protein involved in Fe transport